jgi:hypothetical protein
VVVVQWLSDVTFINFPALGLEPVQCGALNRSIRINYHHDCFVIVSSGAWIGGATGEEGCSNDEDQSEKSFGVIHGGVALAKPDLNQRAVMTV